MLKHLASIDKRYTPAEKFSENYRMRICLENIFRIDKQDDSLVYYMPGRVDNELPFFYSFKLKDGTICPSPKVTLQHIDSSVYFACNSLEVSGDTLVYALFQRKGKSDGVVLNGKLELSANQWEDNLGDKTFWGVTGIPGYHPVSAPFAVAANKDRNKIVLLNTITGSTIDLALLKRHTEWDRIL